ncbi:MAG: hypothetical protein M3P04_07645 [Actinomycetota bacterium]|nr:hypothetical protein [Actinomycetota bacterium]
MEQREYGEWAAVPGIAPGEVAAAASQLQCDGEIFDARADEFGGTHYTWVTGPNPGYGFSVSPTSDDIEQHRTNIRSFLSMIDPRTGHVGED